MTGKKYDIIIVGAGAAGLIAANELLDAGYSVCLLEASVLAGGRIATIRDDMFGEPVEAGAEFIHGDLPLTRQLLEEGNIPYEKVDGKMNTVKRGKWSPEEQHDDHWDLFMRTLGKVKTDRTILEFMQEYFPGEKYNSLRTAVRGYAEGFDLADISKASVLFVKNEWSHENENKYRISGGYFQLIHHLQTCISHKNADIYFNSCVRQVIHDKHQVSVVTTDSRRFISSKIIIAVSVGVLQSESLKFFPPITNHAYAISQLGFGSVIKILLRFQTFFWEQKSADTGFILSDEEIPTWWTQAPIRNGLLTGWLGGPGARFKTIGGTESILKSALQSLSSIFNLPAEKLRRELIHHNIICWDNHPLVKGGYSYNTTSSASAKKILSSPVDDRIFFAGEAIHDGESQGTVEAALQSGISVAKKITGFF